MPDVLIYGLPLIVVVPGLVELAKMQGLPTRWAGLASILGCAVILGLLELSDDRLYGGWASWSLQSLVYGLAAAGLFSQVDKLRRDRE